MIMWENGKISNKIKIRAHHIICLHGFQGYGYSKNFVNNMAQIHAYIKSHPQSTLKIVTKSDLICMECPHHHQEGYCNRTADSNFKIKLMDIMVLKKLGLEDGKEYKAQNIFSRMKKVFKTQNDLQDICGDCYWKNKCVISIPFNE